MPSFISRAWSVRWFALAVLFALVLISACRASPPLPDPPSPNGTPTPGVRTLTLWHSESGDARDALESLAHSFHKDYPDLRVDAVYVGNDDDLAKQVTAAIALGQVPDLVLAERRTLVKFARLGGIKPLDKLIADPDLGLTQEDRADFLRDLLQQGQFPEFKGHTYAFPFDLEAMILFYNPDLLKQIGGNKPPATWDQFADLAGRATLDDSYGWVMQPESDVFSAMLVSRGSALLTDGGDRALVAERNGIAVLSLISQLYKSGAAVMPSNAAAAREEFIAGRALFYISWMSELPALIRLQEQTGSDFEIGVATLPQLDPRDPALLTRGYSFAIPNIPRDQALRNAWFFVRWITAPRQNAGWVRQTDALPLRLSALNYLAADLPTNPRYRQISETFDGTVPHLVPRPVQPRMNRIDQIVHDLWIQAQQPKLDVRATLEDAAARINLILADKP